MAPLAHGTSHVRVLPEQPELEKTEFMILLLLSQLTILKKEAAKFVAQEVDLAAPKFIVTSPFSL
ncbi:hypothetical protein H5410_036348 [Solanum commersonii]|uniref:Uncharacterized protein n=1 Tax=Solanum commersonii TaxID=4109 RepID=A0A9J5Y779_SOLCO|nr:hypothetical protein H5410_036348 [Solanum commersonii]